MLKMTRAVAGLVLGAGMILGTPGRADDWEFATDTDNGIGTDNALFHGSEQIHDLGANFPGPTADEDWYLTSVRQFSSYQFVVDGFTGDLDLTPTSVQRLDANGAIVDNAIVSDAGGVLSLAWLRGGGAAPDTNFVRVQGASCGTTCNELDSYRARYYDTTYTIPRFNNSGTQATVLLVQNASDRTCTVTFWFMSTAGTLLNVTFGGAVNPSGLLVLNTVASVPNQAGSVRIGHTCGYGGLSGKAVSLEPATGFTFDTPVLHRPH